MGKRRFFERLILDIPFFLHYDIPINPAEVSYGILDLEIR